MIVQIVCPEPKRGPAMGAGSQFYFALIGADPVAALLFLLHFASAWYLVGLCWLVQRVQYPLMSAVGTTSFTTYEQGHVTRITPIVAPPMLIELGTGVMLLLWGGAAFRRPLFATSLVLLAAIWISTFALQVPLHDALVKGFDANAHASLVRTNWIRTLAWTARGLLLSALLWRSGWLRIP